MLKTRQFILLAGDFVLACFALVLTLFLGFGKHFSKEILYLHSLPFSILYLFWFVVFYIFGLYDLNSIRPRVEFLLRLAEAFFICLLTGAAFFYLIPLFKITPKLNLFINILIFTLFVFFWRRIFCLLFSSVYQQKIAFLGKNKLAEVLAKEFQAAPHLGYRFISFLNTHRPLLPQLKNKKIDSLVLVGDITPRLAQELYHSLPLKINLFDFSELYESIFKKIPIDFIDQHWFLKNLKEGQKVFYDKIKRLEDIIGACLIIILTIPCWVVIPLLIKLDDGGSVFYRQERVGKNKKVFWLWKFRTMKPDSEKRGIQWAQKDDKRVTRVGKILRRTHFDELPQMINIFKGDISLVGPRPERPWFIKKLERQIPHYHLRHIIKPGFTGWAQINFRYARTVMDSHEKFQYDLYYIKNRSFLLDIGILLKTFYIFFKKNYL